MYKLKHLENMTTWELEKQIEKFYKNNSKIEIIKINILKDKNDMYPLHAYITYKEK